MTGRCDRCARDAAPLTRNRGESRCPTCLWADVDTAGIDVLYVDRYGRPVAVRNTVRDADRTIVGRGI